MASDDKAKGYKTLAIRLDDDVHAQLQLIARLQESTIADEIRHAIDAHLVATRSDPKLSDRAASVLESIEHEAKLRQQAIASLFSDQPEAASAKGRSARGSRKSDEGTSS
jgi:hypothetical protein